MHRNIATNIFFVIISIILLLTAGYRIIILVMYNKQVRIDKTAPIIHSMEIESGLDALIMDLV